MPIYKRAEEAGIFSSSDIALLRRVFDKLKSEHQSRERREALGVSTPSKLPGRDQEIAARRFCRVSEARSTLFGWSNSTITNSSPPSRTTVSVAFTHSTRCPVALERCEDCAEMAKQLAGTGSRKT